MARPPADAVDRLLDVHRRGRQPELNLDAASTFETRPPQAMQLFPQAERSNIKISDTFASRPNLTKPHGQIF